MLVSSAMIYDVFVQSVSLWWVIVPGMLLGIIVDELLRWRNRARGRG